MPSPSPSRFRHFLSSRPGSLVLIVLAVLVVFATYAYVSVIIAIPAMLLFGLAVPIWAGLKRPRFLALVGLVVVLTVAPISTIVITQEIMTPTGIANSDGAISVTGAPLMQNATVHPFLGSTSTNFTWKVTIYPKNLPPNNSTPVWLDLYVSTCPGATGNNSPYCSQPYPFTVFNRTLNPNATSPYVESFTYRIGSNGVWDWQMGIYTRNTTTGKPFFQTLVGDPNYNGIEGPVIGGFAVIYEELVLTVYFQDFLFLAAPFYFVLLIYMLFKMRERRRKEAKQRALGPVPPVGGGPAAPGGPPPPTVGGAPLPSSPGLPASPGPPSASPAVPEFNCPKCNAVVYQGEATCWKCGAALPATLTSSPAGPS